jgi:hypothetical protein
MKKLTLCLLLAMIWSKSHAGADSDVICYKQYKPQTSRLAALTFRTYFDGDLKEYVSGLVIYEKSKTSIPIVFEDEQSIDSKKSGVTEYKRSWLEIVDGKVIGRYIENGSDNGNQFGRSLDYINFRNRSTVSFFFD